MKDTAPFLMWAIIIVFNLTVVVALKYSLRTLNLKEILREKAPTAQPAAAITAAGSGNGSVVMPPDNTSYSRVSGMLGAIVLVAFFWSFGSIIIYEAFVSPSDTQRLVSSVSGYILSGAALFAPYAVNQLSSIFK